MGRDNFVKNSFLLTASNVTTGILGFIFTIYLSKILGAEGMGLYNLVMPIYNLFICLMSAGIVASISKISAIYNEKGEHNNIIKTIDVVAVFNILWALLIGIIVFIAAPLIGKYGVNDSRTISAIRVICPAMICISISNIFKGYFYGTSKISAPAVIDIFEKAMRVVTVSILFFIFQAHNLETMVTLATVALCIGEFQSMLSLYVYYKYCKRKAPHSYEKPESSFQLLFDVLIISLPLCMNGFLTNILGTLATLIIPRRLIAAGFDYSTALSMLGKYTGMALTLITIPLIVVSTVNTLLIPDLSKSMNSGKEYCASLRIKKVIKLAFLLGLATTIVCCVIPNSLGMIFFQRDDLGLYIQVCSLSAPIFFMDVTMFGILNGLNKQGVILRNSLIEAVIELVCLYIFTGIHSINILGHSITMIISFAAGFALNIHEVNKHIDLNFNKFNVIIYILLSYFAYLVLRIISKYLFYSNIILNSLLVVTITALFFLYIGRLGDNEC